MKYNSVQYQVLKLILQCGQVRAHSLKLFATEKKRQLARSNSSVDDTNLSISEYNEKRLKVYQESANKIIKQLLSASLINEVTYSLNHKKNNSDSEKVYRLTEKGKQLFFIITKEESPEESDAKYYIKCYDKNLKQFSSPSDSGVASPMPEKVKGLLLHSDICSLLSGCDVPCFPHDKPSLMYLRGCLKTNTAGLREIHRKGDYADDRLSTYDCTEILKKGIYYTRAELLEFFKECSSEITDTISGCRAEGIFLSAKSCFVIYSSERYNNKILRINIKGEKGLINCLEILKDFTDVYRRIDEFADYVKNEKGEIKPKNLFFNSPYALFISDGEQLAYSIATGNSKGIIRRSNLSSLTNSIEKKFDSGSYAEKTINKATTYLTAASGMYNKMYVVPLNANGMSQLKYLLETPLEKWRSDGLEIMNRFNEFMVTSDAALYPYMYRINKQVVSVTYMPVIEAKELYAIGSSEKYNPLIITRTELLEIVAHSIRKPGTYFNMIDGIEFGKDEAFIYDRSGRIAGESILDAELRKSGLTFNKKTEGKKLAGAFSDSIPRSDNENESADRRMFYNAIARGELDLNEVLAVVEKKNYTPKKIYYHKTRALPICYVSENFGRTVIAAAKRDNISVSQFIGNALKYYIESQKQK